MSNTIRHTYDWKRIENLRSQGVKWRKVAEDPTVYLCCPGDFSSLYRAYTKRRKAANDPNFIPDKRKKKRLMGRLNRMSVGYPHTAD